MNRKGSRRDRKNKDPVQIRLSGSGGQGLITAGVILAEAALLDGKNVVQTQSYGPEARLGASKSDVIISKEKIAYPQIMKPDILLCLSQDSFDKYFAQTNTDTMTIVDSDHVEYGAATDKRIYALPITKRAIAVGSKVVANVVALGAMNVLAGLVDAKSLRAAVVKRVPERFRALNERALEAGEKLIEEMLGLALKA